MPKATMVVPYQFVPPKNGGHKAAFGFCEYVSKETDFTCLSSNNNSIKEAPFEVVPLFEDKKWKYLSPIVAYRFYRYFKKQSTRYCILFQPFMAPLLYVIFKMLKIEWHIYIQNIEFQRFKSMGKWWWRILYLLEKWSFKAADILHFISPEDLKIAQDIFNTPIEKCRVIHFGTSHKTAPANAQKIRSEIRAKHGFEEDELLVIFYGAQSYAPNLEAVKRIIHYINPLLLKKGDLKYRFLICGGGLPVSYNKLEAFENVEYLGFVKDIEAYVLASDVVLNPVTMGGGVKTKVIEALTLGRTVISSETGLIGVETSVCGNKLIGVKDEDYNAYEKAIEYYSQNQSLKSPTSFYDFYHWGRTVKPVVDILK